MDRSWRLAHFTALDAVKAALAGLFAQTQTAQSSQAEQKTNVSERFW